MCSYYSNKIKNCKEKNNLNQKINKKQFPSSKKEKIFIGNSFQQQNINESPNFNNIHRERVANKIRKSNIKKKPENLKPKLDIIIVNKLIKVEQIDFSKEKAKMTDINKNNKCANDMFIMKNINSLSGQEKKDSVSKEINKNCDKFTENNEQQSREKKV